MKKNYLLMGLAGLLAACKVSVPQSAMLKGYQPKATQVVTSDKGVVTAAHPLAVRAGTIMLEKGGNAVDAAVATGFALAVVEPSMSGLGGRLQAIVRLPNGDIRGVDATTQAPASYQAATAPKGADGYATIGLPGVVAGLTKLLQQYGTLPLAVVMAPAIRYAEEGFAVLPGEAARQASVKKMLMKYTGTRRYFLKQDSIPYKAGEILVQTDLATTLKAIAEGGRDAFYKGAVGQKIAADIQANGGVFTAQDLADYQALDAQLLSTSYRGYDVHALSMPCYGAITLEMLNLMETRPLSRYSDADWASSLYQAMKLAYRDRPKQKKDSIQILVSKAYARTLAGQMQIAGPAAQARVTGSDTLSVGHTTHLSTADQSGMMVALTQSLGPVMGSGVATPGLGFMYAQTLGGGYLASMKGGERASSHISPVLLTKGGKPFMALGAAGGDLIPTAVVSVISRVIDRKLPLATAVAAPRVHPADKETMLMETRTGLGWEAAVVDAEKARGFTVREVPQSGRFGRVHAIRFDTRKKRISGAADPDWEGEARAPQKP
ncbi:gamma-glutamyltransferase family protein [Arsenicibacter rosenii]|uniref:Gamma-glutamyltransferase n=1 Tax=Arsenicibacter rosenii TaxID=1750698 RepID=A0A1S2VBQ6_9BACT|nr:gamma-glutamyltransferase [Arsenicibacter rosenii]OIN56122.1 hypothetical protein BLX24_26485 [Arsenicibacter rosenii]